MTHELTIKQNVKEKSKKKKIIALKSTVIEDSESDESMKKVMKMI